MFIKNKDIVEKVIDGSLYILDMDSESSYKLDDTSLIIWNNIEKDSIENISKIISDKYSVNLNQVKSDVNEFVESLVNSNLLKIG